MTTPSASDLLEQLLRLPAELAEAATLREALAKLSDVALVTLQAEHASVRLLGEEGQELVSFARAGAGLDSPPVHLRSGEGVAGWVFEQAQPLALDDAPADSRFKPAEDQGFVIRSLLAVPMLAGGKVVGVMAVSAPEPARFDAIAPLDSSRRDLANMVAWLEHALASPLRLRLSAELLEVGDVGLSRVEAVVRSGRHEQDVVACLSPMVQRGLVEHDGARYRFCPTLPAGLRTLIDATVKRASEQLVREHHVRHRLLGGMIGLDPKMQMVFEMVHQVARIDVQVLITGETGTGKELVARAIHDSSPRCTGFFGAVNCATLTENLFESQVFGHMRGAFTGAVQDYVGLVERCDGGTLFLDEVGDLSLPNQVKLLRFLQEGTFSRLGETSLRRSDFRLISATNRNLQAMVATGSFREDLYYRLAVFPIRVPSLRERLGDLRYLVEGILEVQAQRYRTGEPPTISGDALQQLQRYDWPGNVRELENVMARAVVMAGGGPIDAKHLPEVELMSDRPRESELPPLPDESGQVFALRPLADMERDHIIGVLRSQKGNIKATAEILGISRTTLYKKIRSYRIDAPM